MTVHSTFPIDASADRRPAPAVSHALGLVTLLSAKELAAALGYSAPNDAFRKWCAQLGIRPLPGRRGMYDPMHVRACLDAVQNRTPEGAGGPAEPMTNVEKRRARRAKS